ncbi:unnamed protein product [Heligmosomoides polygyrus]|uniref:Uncharacterized protein n=1 Tax=Heligmosomoides polygyrus TaxID=6339 RepID=A0A3P8CPD2_HELPZ|nr:unnamed protein product [Heligmosomoides polygyrus]
MRRGGAGFTARNFLVSNTTGFANSCPSQTAPSCRNFWFSSPQAGIAIATERRGLAITRAGTNREEKATKNVGNFGIFLRVQHLDSPIFQAVTVSTFKEATDFYLSSQVCRSFLITAVTSTFGWWLAFFSIDQNAVFYVTDHRPHADKVPSKDLFLGFVKIPRLLHARYCGVI